MNSLYAEPGRISTRPRRAREAEMNLVFHVARTLLLIQPLSAVVFVVVRILLAPQADPNST